MSDASSSKLPHNVIDIAGQVFGRLTIISFCFLRNGRSVWLCQCSCGRRVALRANDVRRGATKSCGCLHSETSAENGRRNRTHGKSGSPEYAIWIGVLRRCCKSTRDEYERYGGRGVTACNRWRDSFEAFYADMGPRPSPQHSIDRIDNNRGYEPGNCRWATAKEQQRNKRNNRMLTHDGRTQCATDWAEEVHITRGCLLERLRRGWSVARALGYGS